MRQVKFNLTIGYEMNEQIAILKMLKGKGADVTADNNYAIIKATGNNHNEH